MVTEFCGFSKGVVGKKLPSDSTLNNMKKEDLIKLLHLAQHNYETLMQFYNNAVNVNMAQLNNNGWIPCSERLPDTEHISGVSEAVLVTTNINSIFTAEYHGNGKWLDDVADWSLDVIAWMPLPAPYQQKEGE